MATAVLESKETKMNLQQQQIFNLVPTTLAEAMDYAKLIAESSICPKDFKGKPGDVLVAMQMGAEVGLKPLQALQNIAVINGRPSIWGDAALAIVKAHRECEDINEWEALDENNVKTAYCTVKRRGQTPQTRKFSYEDAKRAGLIGKVGPWTQYEPRMMQMRARGFALRDTFADALKGFILAEEAMDLPPEKDITPTATNSAPETPASKLQQLKNKLGVEAQTNEQNADNAPANHNNQTEQQPASTPVVTAEEVKSMMEKATNKDDLDAAVDLVNHLSEEHKPALRAAYTKKLKELRSQVTN